MISDSSSALVEMSTEEEEAFSQDDYRRENEDKGTFTPICGSKGMLLKQ